MYVKAAVLVDAWDVLPEAAILLARAAQSRLYVVG